MAIQLPPFQEALLEGKRISLQWFIWLRDQVVQKVLERPKPTAVITSAYTTRPFDHIIANPTAGGFTITFHERPTDGDTVWYSNNTTSVNTVTFQPATGHTIHGTTSVTSTTSRESIFFVFCADLLNWVVYRCAS